MDSISERMRVLLPKIFGVLIILAALLCVCCSYMQISMVNSLSNVISQVSTQLHDIQAVSDVAEQFHVKFYNSQQWASMTWLGIPMLQNPNDSQVMQELLFEIKPDVIIEAGTFCGATALYYATIMDQIKPLCKIFTIDIAPQPQVKDAAKFMVWKKHVFPITGSSVDPAVVDQIKKQIPNNAVVLVTLDSDHHHDHVLKELQIYSQFVTPGSYLVLQDTNINGHPVFPTYGPGPDGSAK